MLQRLEQVAQRAQNVAYCARRAIKTSAAPKEMNELNEAMIAYRGAAVFYLTHPSVSDYVRADATKYDGETRQALESIAELIDRLNEP